MESQKIGEQNGSGLGGILLALSKATIQTGRKILKKSFIKYMLSFCVFLLTAQVSAQAVSAEDALRASNDKVVFLLKEIQGIKSPAKAKLQNPLLESLLSPAGHGHCDDDSVTCASYCEGRRSDGSCYSYGADKCGPGMKCAANCVGRRSDGTCYSYNADHCGLDAACSPNCEGRRSDGTCYSYGADICY